MTPPSSCAAGRRRSPSCSTCSTGRRWWPARPTPGGWTAPARRGRRARAVGATPRWCRWPSTPPTPRRRWSGRPSWPRPAAAARGRGTRSAARSSWATAARSTASPSRRSGATATACELDGRYADVDVDRLSALESRLTRRRPAVRRRLRRGGRLAPGRGRRRHPPRHPGRRGSRARARPRRSSSPIRVEVGQEVEAGQTIVVLESMKMETAVRAPFAGRVREVLAAANAQVDAGAPLLNLEQVGGDVEEASGDRVELPGARRAVPRPPRPGAVAARRAPGADHRLRRQRPLRPELVAEYDTARNELPADDPELLRGELTVLTTFADLSELSRNRPSGSEEEADAAGAQPARVLPRLPALPRRRPRGAAGELPRPAVAGAAALRRPRPRARPGAGGGRATGCTWRSSASPTSCPPCRRCSSAGSGPSRPWRRPARRSPTCSTGSSLATQLRYPAVGDLARAVRYRYFEEPVVRENREVILDQAAGLLAELEDDRRQRRRRRGDAPRRGAGREPGAADPPARPARRAGVHHPRPGRRGADPALLPQPRPAERALGDVRGPVGRRSPTTTCAGSGCTCSPGWGRSATCPAALAEVVRRSADVPEPNTRLLDLYVSWPDRPADADDLVGGAAPDARPARAAARDAPGHRDRVRRGPRGRDGHLPAVAGRAGRGPDRSAGCTR